MSYKSVHFHTCLQALLTYLFSSAYFGIYIEQAKRGKGGGKGRAFRKGWREKERWKRRDREMRERREGGERENRESE